MDLIDTVYSVSLHDYPSDLRPADRVRIETRYAAELERAFGSPDNVAAALDTMESLQSSPPDILSPGDLQLVQHWAKASAAARQAALRDVGDAEGCYFDVERVPF
ncbi:hypothetical protein [Acidovorax sp.]|uniref:hypothetical protein n=1 Tax=Acidovorax sp. TaxID=1872122 RepID=UPI00260538CF|nr:hypothetical protein [Acidovorax sp.]